MRLSSWVLMLSLTSCATPQVLLLECPRPTVEAAEEWRAAARGWSCVDTEPGECEQKNIELRVWVGRILAHCASGWAE